MEEPSNSAMMAEYPSPIPKNIVSLHNNLNGISQICYVENKGFTESSETVHCISVTYPKP